jgi:hypothetical protein
MHMKEQSIHLLAKEDEQQHLEQLIHHLTKSELPAG